MQYGLTPTDEHKFHKNILDHTNIAGVLLNFFNNIPHTIDTEYSIILTSLANTPEVGFCTQ
jgi:hypothetical protein